MDKGSGMMGFEFRELPLEGAYLVDLFQVGDCRGGFVKTFEKDIFREAGIEFHLNETFASTSMKNVIRGLHFQTRNPQAKIVSVVAGKAWDVIVDLRRNSATYKQWYSHELSAENHLAFYVPRGFAHGFASLEDGTVMLYQCDGKYDKESDSGIVFNDHIIGIEWPIREGEIINSKRDLGLLSFSDFEKFYNSFCEL